MLGSLGKLRKSRGRPYLAWLVIATVVALPAMLQSSPAQAAQGKRNILPKAEAEAYRDPDFDDSVGDLVMPESCGSGNITGKFNVARWTVKSSIGPGSTVWVGDEWTVSFEMGQTYAGPPYGNNGPDPLNLELKPTGPVESAAAPEGRKDDIFNVYAHDSGNPADTKVRTAIGAWGYSFDENASPGVLEFSDGVNVTLITHMKANAAGVVSLPKIHISGYDSTTPAGPVSCDLNVGWSWNVATPLSPTGKADNAKVNASYTSFNIDDASNGSHRIRIPVLANDDDPNTDGGPGDLNELGISDWSAQSLHGGQVSCGTIKNAAHSTAIKDLGKSCEYQPKQGYAGADLFNYKVRQKSDGLEKLVPVNITVLGNTSPSASDATFNTDQGEDGDFSVLPFADDPQNDPIACATNLVSGPFPAVGTATMGADCTFHWNNTSPAFAGDVGFTYRVCDTHPTLAMADMGAGTVKLPGFSDGDLSGAATRRCQNADVTIKVKALGLATIIPPMGVTDTDVVDAGYAGDAIGPYTVSIPVLANDTDGNGPKPTMPTAAVALKAGPALSEGVAIVRPNGNIEFTPTDGFSGPVSFTYKVCEDPATQNPVYVGSPNCGTGVVNIDVIGNQAPFAAPDEYNIESTDVLVNESLAANDSEPELEIIECTTTPVSVSAPAKVEALSIGGNCALSFDPVDDATGSVEVQYEICDWHSLSKPAFPLKPYGKDGRSPGNRADRCSVGTATINLTVSEDVPEVVDPAPVCADDEIHTAFDTPVVIDVLANDSDVNAEGVDSPLVLPGPNANDPLATNEGASIQLDGQGTKLVFTPGPGFDGEDGFDYVSVDTAGQTCIGKVVVIVDSQGPTQSSTTTTTADGPTTTTTADGGTSTTAGPGNGSNKGSNGGQNVNGTLPVTGSNNLALVAFGVVLVAAGVGALRLRRRA